MYLVVLIDLICETIQLKTLESSFPSKYSKQFLESGFQSQS